MNFHNKEWIMNEMEDHYEESLLYFPSDAIVCLCYQGSGNYGIDTPVSDVDTKMVVVPSFKDIVFSKKEISTTHVRANNAHTDWKDIRILFKIFRKQNANFLEILFTDYKIQNPLYLKQWERLVKEREAIAHYSPSAAVKSMKGIAMEKYFSMEHKYPSKAAILEEFGYDGKQLCHLLRIEELIQRYIAGEAYEDCLITRQPDFLIDIKMQKYPLEQARTMAEKSLAHINEMCADFLTDNKDINIKVDELLDDVQYEIMRKAILG